MAYSTGSVLSIADIRTSIITACTPAGWAWDSTNEVLYKGNLFVRIRVAAYKLNFLGRTTMLGGDAPGEVSIGRFCPPENLNTGFKGNTGALSFPATFHAFVFDDEVYYVINYDSISYQFVTFGKSTVPGLDAAATGMYLAASNSKGEMYSGVATNHPFNFSVDGGASAWYGRYCPGLFWYNSPDLGTSYPPYTNYYVHSNLDGHGWHTTPNGSLNGESIGIAHISNVLKVLPSAFNTEAVLLPARCYKLRPSNKVSLVADLANARITRIDNYDPGQVITIGSTQWKVFPFFRKNTDQRDGDSSNGCYHTGTLGWAIKYGEL